MVSKKLKHKEKEHLRLVYQIPFRYCYFDGIWKKKEFEENAQLNHGALAASEGKAESKDGPSI